MISSGSNSNLSPTAFRRSIHSSSNHSSHNNQSKSYDHKKGDSVSSSSPYRRDARVTSYPPSNDNNSIPRRKRNGIYSMLTYLLVPVLLYGAGRSIRFLVWHSPKHTTSTPHHATSVQSLQERLRSSFVQPRTKKQTTTTTTTTPQQWTQNLPRIQSLLQSQSSTWEPFAQFPISQTSSATSSVVDVTQNLPRIQDYAHPRILKEETIPAASTTFRNLHNTSSSVIREKETTSQGPLNIVLFYADDWTMNVLGALNPLIQTPHIDAMAQKGVLFPQNCVTTSICWISRNTLATGVYSAIHQTVEVQGMQMFNETVPWLDTLYPLLKRNGYHTGLIGKWHALKPKEFIKDTFDVIKNYYNKHWFIRNGKRRHVTDLNQQDAIAFLRSRPVDKHFALTVSFFATHAWEGETQPYQPMPTSLAWYANQTMPTPKTATERHWQQLPWFFDEKNMARARWRDRFDTSENYQSNVKDMYRMATEVDAAVGAIVQELKDQGVHDQTLLVFTTDNGNLQGEHGLAEKWYPFEESIKVPLVIQDPRMPEKAKGSRNEAFTLSVDLAPTLLAAAQIPVSTFMQGRDISALYLNPTEATKTWRQDFFYEWNQGGPIDATGHHKHSRNTPAVFALIRKDYKYFYWPETKYEQLFRVEKDPYDEFDIFNATTTKFALEIMKARYKFLKSWAQSGNPV